MATLLKRKKGQAAPLFVQTMCWIMLLWFILLSITLALTLRYSLDTLHDKIDDTLSSMVTTIATSPTVRVSVEAGVCDPLLVEYLDDLVEAMQDLDVITIADRNSTRIYHINKELIGLQFVGGDEAPALEETTYFADATGTMGYQHRFFHPVRDDQGTVIGFVMASTTHTRMDELRNHIAATYGKLMLILTACTLVFSAFFAVYLNRILRGVRPEDVMRTYLTQNDVLNSLDEGLISLDPEGHVRLVNQAAEKMLGRKEALLLRADIDSLLLQENGISLKGTEGENLPSSHPNILLNSLKVANSSHWARQVLILKDKSELRRQAEQLGGTRHIVNTLRANNHEFMNKLQIISGMLQMGRVEEAKHFIGNIAQVHEHIQGPVLQRIRNTGVAALILGKGSNMRERDVDFVLMNNSYLPEQSRYLTTDELVTVVGNLLENAIEATDIIPAEDLRAVAMQITEDDKGLLIQVSDTGIGIEDEDLPLIFNTGFSTKAATGRGVGMSRIKEIVDRRGGSIEVETEPGSGTTFTLIFSRERGGYA